jgi:hypothetical protein
LSFSPPHADPAIIIDYPVGLWRRPWSLTFCFLSTLPHTKGPADDQGTHPGPHLADIDAPTAHLFHRSQDSSPHTLSNSPPSSTEALLVVHQGRSSCKTPKMLSNPLHRFSAYNTLPSSNMLSNGHIASNHMHSSALDTLAHGSQYALQQLQQHVDIHQNSQVHRGHNAKHRQHPYNGGGATNGRSMNGASGPIRRRISRACDQCNQLRTKCDGQSPCAHCVGKFLL